MDADCWLVACCHRRAVVADVVDACVVLPFVATRSRRPAFFLCFVFVFGIDGGGSCEAVACPVSSPPTVYITYPGRQFALSSTLAFFCFAYAQVYCCIYEVLLVSEWVLF